MVPYRMISASSTVPFLRTLGYARPPSTLALIVEPVTKPPVMGSTSGAKSADYAIGVGQQEQRQLREIEGEEKNFGNLTFAYSTRDRYWLQRFSYFNVCGKQD